MNYKMAFDTQSVMGRAHTVVSEICLTLVFLCKFYKLARTYH